MAKFMAVVALSLGVVVVVTVLGIVVLVASWIRTLPRKVTLLSAIVAFVLALTSLYFIHSVTGSAVTSHMSLLIAFIALDGGSSTVALLLLFFGTITRDMPGLSAVVASIVV